MKALPHELEIIEHEKTIEMVKKKNENSELWSNKEIQKMEDKIVLLKKEVYSRLKPWDRVNICRHSDRPNSSDYIKHICKDFIEVFGDRAYRDDPALIAGFASIEKTKFMVIAQEKGNDTQSRLNRNFGMMHPEGYRKALRLMQLAQKFDLPILCFIDTPGAYPGFEAEERGQGFVIAKNLMEMARITVPIIAVLIGEGCSGGALGIGVADVIGMLEHAYYSVISPEGCASILWKDAGKKAIAAESLKMQAEDLMQMKVIDEIILEPMGGAHHDPQKVYLDVKNFILKEVKRLQKVKVENLLENRFQKYRKIGKFKTELVSHEASSQCSATQS